MIDDLEFQFQDDHAGDLYEFKFEQEYVENPGATTSSIFLIRIQIIDLNWPGNIFQRTTWRRIVDGKILWSEFDLDEGISPSAMNYANRYLKLLVFS
jgi:hypothetical protein